MHPHWLRSERSASASWATPGNENDSSEAEPDAPHGRSRINLRESLVSTRDVALVFVFEAPLPRAVLFFPAVTLSAALEPAIALPAFVCFEPAIQFAQARFDRRIDLAEMPQPIPLDLQFVERGLREYPIRLPVAITLEDKLVAEMAMPLVGIVLPLPFVNRDRPERLLDFDELPAPTTAATEVAIVMHDDGADDGQNRFEHWTIPASQCAFAEHIEATPPALDGLFEFDDCVTPSIESVVFADGSDHLAVREIV